MKNVQWEGKVMNGVEVIGKASADKAAIIVKEISAIQKKSQTLHKILGKMTWMQDLAY